MSEDGHDFVIPKWVVYDDATGEYINCHTGIVLNAHYFLNRDGTVSGIGNGELICGEACVHNGKYLVCVEKVSRSERTVMTHKGAHRDKSGIAWPNEENAGK